MAIQDSLESRKLVLWNTPRGWRKADLWSALALFTDLPKILKCRVVTSEGFTRGEVLFLTAIDRLVATEVITRRPIGCHSFIPKAGRTRGMREHARALGGGSRPVLVIRGKDTPLSIATFNVNAQCRTTLALLEAQMVQQNRTSDILALQETRLKGGAKAYLDGYKYFGRDAGDTGVGFAGGVGLFIGSALLACARIKVATPTISHSMLWIEIHIGQDRLLHVCSFYAPQKSDPDASQVFSELTERTLECQKTGSVIVIGDFNGRIGCSVTDPRIGRFGDPEVKANGTRVKRFLSDADLFCANARRMDSDGHETYRAHGGGGHTSMIDFIMVSRDLWPDQDAPVATPWRIPTGSDHFPLTASVRNFRVKKRRRVRKVAKWRTGLLSAAPVALEDGTTKDYAFEYSEEANHAAGQWLDGQVGNPFWCLLEADDDGMPPPAELAVTSEQVSGLVDSFREKWLFLRRTK